MHVAAVRGLAALALVTAAAALGPTGAGADTLAATSCPTPTVGSFTAGPADAPLASCLLSIGDTADDASATAAGLAVTVSGLNALAGLAADPSTLYLLDGSSGNIVTVARAELGTPSATSRQDVSATGTVHPVDWSAVGGFGSLGATMQLSLAYSHGCLFIPSSDTNNSFPPDTDASAIFPGTVRLYCIDTDTWTVSSVAVPSGCPLPIGHYYLNGNLIDFPDGRIGKVSTYLTHTDSPDPQMYGGRSVPDGGYTSVLRTYTVSGTGGAATLACSTDYDTHDADGFAVDDHGIATDGTYLYRIKFSGAAGTHDVTAWRLSGTSAPDPVYRGFYARPFGNMTYLSYDPTGHDYLIGNYSSSQFYVSPAADPGPGVGNPLTPRFGTPTPTADGFTVAVTDYDPGFDWSATATGGATATIDDTGLVTVTGLARGASATVTVTATQTGIPDGSATVTGSATPATVPGAPRAVRATGGDRQATVSWTAPADDGGAPVTHYTVTAADATDAASGGQTVTTADGTARTATLTGLTNGDRYTFAVTATNAVGTGPASAGGPVTPIAPPPPPVGPVTESPRPTPTPSTTAPSTTAPTSAPTPVPSTTTPPSTATTSGPPGPAAGGPSSATSTPTPAPLPPEADSAGLAVSTHNPGRGAKLILTATGFAPGSTVDFWLHSDPIFLGSVVADRRGVAVLAVTLDPGLSRVHHVQAVGTGPRGARRNLAQTITIGGPAVELADTGADPGRLALFGMALVVAGTALLRSERGRRISPKRSRP